MHEKEPIELELLHQLAILPNAADIDWRAEFARQYSAAEAARVVMQLKIADLEKRSAVPEPSEIEAVAKTLAELTGANVSIDHEVWYYPYNLSPPKTNVEYRIYQQGEFIRGKTLAEADAQFRKVWESRHPGPSANGDLMDPAVLQPAEIACVDCKID